MSTLIKNRGAVLNLLLALVAAAALGWAAVIAVPGMARRTDPLPVTAAELDVTLRRLGLDPATLAAAGCTAQQATGVVEDLRAHLTPATMQGLRNADDAVAAARQDVDRLERLAQSGLASQQDLTALTAARSASSTATADRSTRLVAARAAAAADLTAAQSTAIATITGNTGWELATPYLAATRTQTEWVGLRDALANERINPAIGREVDPDCHQTVLAADAVTATATARANLETNLAAVTTAWNQEVNE